MARPARNPTVALCVTGSIAAYKAVELARLLVKAGRTVLPVMTASAARFVGGATLAGITGQSVVDDMWDSGAAGEIHVRLADASDVVAVVPATADTLARLASGRADDVVTALALCARGPVLAAPAMHPRMWEHPATRRNVAELAAQGRIVLVGPTHGEVASGELGMGRMAEPAAIAAAIDAALAERGAARETGGDERGRADLAEVRLVVTAGPTVEDIDAVRFLGNRSSGKMGFAVAARAAERGARVVLVTGPVERPTPAGVSRVDVRSTADMRAALGEALGADLGRADALVMAAAVADYRPAQVVPGKMKKGSLHLSLALVKTPDLLAEIGAARAGRGRPVLVGFAVEAEGGDALIAYARRKLDEKRVDLVVANEASASLGRDDDRATFVTADGVEPLPTLSKGALADRLLDRVRERLDAGV